MCGRFDLHIPRELLEKIFGTPLLHDIQPQYNIAPTQQVTVIRSSQDGIRSIDSLRWGLIPSWAKDPSIGSRMINARSETVDVKPAFRNPLKHRRCIIPANGFYEWLRHESRMCDCPAAHPAGPAVPSAVPYEVGRRGNKSSKSPRTM